VEINHLFILPHLNYLHLCHLTNFLIIIFVILRFLFLQIVFLFFSTNYSLIMLVIFKNCDSFDCAVIGLVYFLSFF